MGIALQGGWWLRGSDNLQPNSPWSLPALSQAEQDTLFATATSCPFIWGDFIYKARAFVGYHDTTQTFINECEIPYEEPALRLAEKDNSEKDRHGEISIGPNPAKDRITVNGVGHGGAKMFICDIFGQTKVNLLLPQSQSQTVSLGVLDAGIYFVRLVYPDGKEKLHKLVVTQ